MTWPKRKYRAIKTEVNGVIFASKKEAHRYLELLLLQGAGEIRKLEIQVKYPIDVNGIHVCDYIADFRYVNRSGDVIVEDVKGMKTPVYNLKKKLMWACYHIKILET